MLRKIYRKILINYYLKKGLFIGRGTRILGRVDFGSEPYLVKIGSGVTITDGVKFITHDGGRWIFRNDPAFKAKYHFGTISIDDNVFIGVNSIIMPGVIIGRNTVVAAGSVVTRKLEANMVYAGVPAKPLYSVAEYRTKMLKKSVDIEKIDQMSSKEKKQMLISILWSK